MTVSELLIEDKYMDVEIYRTVKTPEVHFRNGIISIAGRSILEESDLFYNPLSDLLQNYTSHSGKISQIDLSFEYLNGSSTRCLLSMIRILEKVYDQQGNLVINWYYEDDDDNMKDIGHIFESLTSIPFNILPSEERK